MDSIYSYSWVDGIHLLISTQSNHDMPWQAVDRRRRERCGSWPLQVTSWPFSALRLRLAWIFTFLYCACARKTKCTFGQVDQGEQSHCDTHQPSHHGDHALRLRSLNWCPLLTTRTRTDSHFWFFRNAPITLRILLICDSYPLFLCLCIYSTYFLNLHIFLLWPHFGFDMLFDLYVLLFALREAFKL